MMAYTIREKGDCPHCGGSTCVLMEFVPEGKVCFWKYCRKCHYEEYVGLGWTPLMRPIDMSKDYWFDKRHRATASKGLVTAATSGGG